MRLRPTFQLAATTALALAVAPAPGLGQTLGVQAFYVTGYEGGTQFRPDLGGADGIEQFITIEGDWQGAVGDGSSRMPFNELVDWVTVSCWICEDGSCDSDSPWGPSVSHLPVSEGGGWVTEFWAPGEIPSGTPWPEFSNYYCSVGIGSDPDERSGGALNVPPSTTTQYPWATIDEQQTQLLELSGSLGR